MLEQKRVIFYELNEVPWRVFDHFIAQNPGSAVARLSKQARCYQTVTEDQGHLSPWITWPSLHRGVSNARHGILDFGQNLDDVNGEYPPIWTQLANRDVRVGLFGSLHSYPLPDARHRYAFYVPDTFAAGSECLPDELSAFQDFNLKIVRQSGRNVASGLPRPEGIRLLAAARGLGMTAGTFTSLLKQLMDERFKKERICRRRTSQVVIAFDFFLRQLRLTRPDFATFFTNHVASSMHRYWPATFADDYTEMKFSADWRAMYAQEIDYTMSVADRQIARLMDFSATHGYVLCVAGSMGQAAVDDGRGPVRTQLNIGSHKAFTAALGLEAGEWKSLLNMVPLYTYEITAAAEDRFLRNLAALKINGKALDVVKYGHNVFRVAVGHTNLDEEDIHIQLHNSPRQLAEVGLINMRIDDEAGSNAYHIPQGALLVYDPNEGGTSERHEISTLEIAPAILKNFGIDRPQYMAAPARV